MTENSPVSPSETIAKAMEGVTIAKTADEFERLLEDYFCAGVREGQDGRHEDDADCSAQKARSSLEASFTAALAVQTQQGVEVNGKQLVRGLAQGEMEVVKFGTNGTRGMTRITPDDWWFKLPAGSFKIIAVPLDDDTLVDVPAVESEPEEAAWQARYWIKAENRWSNWITNPQGHAWAYDEERIASGITQTRKLFALSPRP